MLKRWKKRTHIKDIPLDRPDFCLRVHLITWPDDTRCIQVMKYAFNQKKNAFMAYRPSQYIQIPVRQYAEVAGELHLLSLVRITPEELLLAH